MDYNICIERNCPRLNLIGSMLFPECFCEVVENGHLHPVENVTPELCEQISAKFGDDGRRKKP